MKIMIVEDEANLRRLYCEILGAQHQVTSFDNPVKAFAHYVKNSRSFDLILTDARMPYRSGQSLIYDVKTLNPQQKIVMISGWPDEKGLQAQFKVHSFSKPITRADLIQIVDYCGAEESKTDAG